jgi:hypothetical protein
MKRSRWQTGPALNYTQPLLRPTGGQLLRQLLLLALILLIWGGGFLVFLGATSSSGGTSVAEVALSAPLSPAPTSTPTQAATNTPQPAATATAGVEPTATSRPTETPTAMPATTGPSPTENGAISYQRDVQPIFDQICVKCHGGEEVREGLNLKTYAEVLQGSNNGPVIVPGDVANSFLIEQIVKGEMPKRGPQLLPAQIRLITEWVAAGAPDN